MNEPERRKNRFAALGAAFLMAASSVGPGFLIQTSRFSAQGGLPFFYVILFVTLADVIAKANIWSVVGTSGMSGAQIADRVRSGLGVVLTVMIAIGGLSFNVGNVGGVALGLEAATGLPARVGALIGGALAAGIFCFKRAKCVVDRLAIVLSAIIAGSVLTIVIKTRSPVLLAVSSFPTFDALSASFFPLITLLGGTCGGYIPFSGAHRLLENGVNQPKKFRRSAALGAFISGFIRILLFFCVIGVCCAGGAFRPATAALIVNADNPAAQTFLLAAGDWGRRLFGVTLFAAGLSCTIGAAYTSVSFLKTLHPFFARNERACILGMIGTSTLILLIFGGAGRFAILSGTVNGFVLPVSLGCILLASRKRDVVGDYRHPLFLTAAGWLIVLLSAVLAVRSLVLLFVP